MENASKALLIAAGVLIALLIVSLLIFARNRIGDFYNSDKDIEDTVDVTKFNLQFTNYERKDVKGVELISLSNKIADYNFRHSNSDESKNDEGYQFITLTIKFPDPAVANSKLAYRNERVYINKNEYVQTGVFNDELTIINNEMYAAENNYGKKNLRNLSKAIFALYPEDEPNDRQKINIVKKFIEITASKDVSGNSSEALLNKGRYEQIGNCDLDNETQVNEAYGYIKDFKDISIKYYEYTQFKKGVFKFVNESYDTNGRIISMEFEFTGGLS